MKKFHFPGILIILLTAISAIAGDFCKPTGDIVGTVIDSQTGLRISNANILVENTNQSAPSDSKGIFTISGLKPGKYKLKCQTSGYAPLTMEEVEVKKNEITKTVLKLEQVPILSATAPVILPKKAQVPGVDPHMSIGDAPNKVDPEITIGEATNAVDPEITVKGTEHLPFGKPDSLKVKDLNKALKKYQKKPEADKK